MNNLILECLNSERGEGFGKPIYEKVFEQKLAEKMLKKSKNWRLKEGQGYQFKDRVLNPSAVNAPRLSTEEKAAAKAAK